MDHNLRVGLATGLMALVLLAGLTGCGGGGNSSNNRYTGTSTTGHISLTSFNETASNLMGSLRYTSLIAAPGPGFSSSPAICYSNAGPPDYIKLTLTRIELQGEFTGSAVIWEGEQNFTIDGTTPITLSNSDVSGIPTDKKITRVILTFNSLGKIKGTLYNKTFWNSANMADTDTYPALYTKSAYSYNALTAAGGISPTNITALTTGSAEEMDVYFSKSGAAQIETPADFTVSSNQASPQITILFDLSRMLRFYNGKGNGISPANGSYPADPLDQAYLFAHSNFRNCAVSFLGDPGTIQGYEVYCYASQSGSYALVTGWMSLAFTAGGQFLAGNLMCDADNTLTVAKGNITAWSDAGGGNYNFSYAIGAPGGGTTTFNLTGFEKLSAVDQYTDFANWSATNGLSGKTYFKLKKVVAP